LCTLADIGIDYVQGFQSTNPAPYDRRFLTSIITLNYTNYTYYSQHANFFRL